MNERESNREPWEVLSIFMAAYISCFVFNCIFITMDYVFLSIQENDLWLQNHVTEFLLL
jgi:hypothetical protein